MTKNIFLYMYLTLLVLVSNAGLKDFKIKQYGIEENFEGIFVYSIVQDIKGYLWLSTDEGLYRYDGESMINLSNQDSTINDLVTASCITSKGELYFGFAKGGVSQVENNTFKTIISPDAIPSKINRIVQDSDGSIWVLSQNSGLARISNGQSQILSMEMLDETIAYDLVLSNGDILIATNDGLALVAYKEGELSHKGFIDGSYGKSITALYKDIEENRLWVGSEEGLFFIEKNEKILTEVSEFKGKRVSSVVRDMLGALWVGTTQSGLFQVTFKGGQIDKVSPFDDAHGFPGNQINSLFVDREDEIWVGTFGRGLVQLNRAFFIHYELTKSSGIEGVKDIHEVNENFYYLATDVGLVKAYNRPGKDSLNFEIIKATSRYSLNQILVKDHIIWMGTDNSGLVKYDTKANTFKKLELNPVDPGLSHMVRYLALAPDGSLWVSIAGNGVYNLTIEGKLIRHFNTRNGFYHNEVFAILPDKAGNVWFGAHTVGLAILKAGGNIDFLTKDEIFPGRNINSISQDERGKVWIATAGEGLYSFDGNEFERFDSKRGLISDYCNAVAVDDAGQIWVGHRMGLSLIQPEYGIVTQFDHPSELGETEAVINSVEKDANGNIWFGHPYGLTKVVLPHIQHQVREKETLIQNLRLFFNDVDLKQFLLNKNAKELGESDLEFSHSDNHITFDFISINLKNPDDMYYQYKLEGYDKQWSPVVQASSATFTNLDPGTYTFKVRESAHPRLWTDEVHSLTFEIDHPYWEKWWFYILQITFILGVMFGTFFLSKRIHNHFIIRLMVYVSIFLLFEYIHTELEPYVESVAGETPIFQVGINLILALILLPIEFNLEARLRRRAKKREAHLLSTEDSK